MLYDTQYVHDHYIVEYSIQFTICELVILLKSTLSSKINVYMSFIYKNLYDPVCLIKSLVTSESSYLTEFRYCIISIHPVIVIIMS
jgi:hypothetical protein